MAGCGGSRAVKRHLLWALLAVAAVQVHFFKFYKLKKCFQSRATANRKQSVFILQKVKNSPLARHACFIATCPKKIGSLKNHITEKIQKKSRQQRE